MSGLRDTGTGGCIYHTSSLIRRPGSAAALFLDLLVHTVAFSPVYRHRSESNEPFQRFLLLWQAYNIAGENETVKTVLDFSKLLYPRAKATV